MKTAARAVLVAGTLLSAAPALAQYYPTQPPPPPPQYYPPPPPVYYQPPPPPGDGKIHYTLRASGGVAFASSGYYCGYYYTYYSTTYACGAGYTAVWPDVNLDLDVWINPRLGLSLGANVMWGQYTPNVSGVAPNTIYSTTWEPHIDVLASLPSNPQVKGRVRFGFGLYIAEANGNGFTTNNQTYNSVGGAFRLGFGASLLANSPVGIGIDAIFEAGWIGSSYVSTVQLLIGPELHF